MENELQRQELLSLKFPHEWDTVAQVKEIEQDILDATDSEKSNLSLMREEADLLRRQAQEQESVKLDEENKIQHELQVQRNKNLQQQEANRIAREIDNAVQRQLTKQIETEAKQKHEAILRYAARHKQSTELLTYEKADIQFAVIKHYASVEASSQVLRETATHLRSRCVKSQDAILPISSANVQKSASDGSGAKAGAIIGGMFGIIGGPLGIAFGAAAGGLIGSMADYSSDSSATSQPSFEQRKWATLISDIDELLKKLP